MTAHSRLEQLGFNLQHLSDQQLSALESLTDEEIALLAKIKQTLDNTEGDVEAHAIDGGGIVW